MQKSEVYEKAQIKQAFETLEREQPELYTYSNTFYWTAVNLFGAYRHLSTGLITGNTDTEILVQGARKAASYAISLAVSAACDIPIVGSVVGILDNIISDIYGAVKQNKFDNKVNAINKVIIAKLGMEEDISLNVAKVALAITKAKEQEILHPAPTPKAKGIAAGINWIQDKLSAVHEKVLPTVKLHDTSNAGIQLALEDVTLLIAYLCTNHEAVVNEDKPLDQQITSIIQNKGLENLLTSAATASLEHRLKVFAQVENAIGQKDLEKLEKKAANGKWSKSLSPGKEVEEFLQDDYIIELLKNLYQRLYQQKISHMQGW